MGGRNAPVVVIGGGISGIACARVLADAGHEVRVLDRGHRLGGRMAVRTEDLGGAQHPVDVGASYFTVRDPRFAAVVDAWRDAGLARVWTDTFQLVSPEGRVGTTTGLPRWGAIRRPAQPRRAPRRRARRLQRARGRGGSRHR